MSAMYPRLAELKAQKERADRHIQDELASTFMGKRVCVNHHRGSYTGLVVGITKNGNCSVIVKNDTTGKTTERYPLSCDIHGRPEVELISGCKA
jgi:hypothetical protein